MTKRRPPVSDYGMTAKCQELLCKWEAICYTYSSRAVEAQAYALLLAVEWCKANECEFAAWRLRLTGRWGYIIRDVRNAKPQHDEKATTPMAAVRQMQKWMAANDTKEER